MANQTMAPAEIDTVRSEAAYRAIRNEIMTARIQPGAKLKVDVLQKQFGFSSSPLREALVRLAAEDFVVADQRRGFRAARASRGDLDDITQYRLLIEVHGLTDSIERGAKSWEANIVAALARLEAVEEQLPRPDRSHAEVWIERHKEFHMALISAASSSRLQEQCSSLFDQSQRYRNLYALHRTGLRNGSTEHRRILEAALDRNKTLAATLLKEHIAKTAAHVRQYLE